MKVLVACEFSGVVRDAFIKRGHDAWSCDLLPTTSLGKHIQGDAIYALKMQDWDLVIAHPPCTHICSSGARWFEQKRADGRHHNAICFFMDLVDTLNEIEVDWAIENPIGVMSTEYRKPNQIIQPWQFGHGETKATCLWMRGLPLLTPTNIVEGRESRIHKMAPSKDRGAKRSITYQGIANAMAEQWG